MFRVSQSSRRCPIIEVFLTAQFLVDSLLQILRRIGRVEIALESDNLDRRPRMEIPKRLIDCLNENKVRYEILHHSEAITAQRIA